jgi:23S rRNA (cytosine1962-C5)-methyltransferase
VRTLVVARGHAKPLWAGHPWVHASSVVSLEPGEGDVVLVADESGRPIGRAWLSVSSAIVARLFDRGRSEEPEADVIARRLEEAVALRRRLFPDPIVTNAYRLVHGEGDGLPGLVVDRFGDVLVAQFSTRPLQARRAALTERLLAATGAKSLRARAGGKEAEEGIRPEEVSFHAGEAIPERVLVREEGVAFALDLERGQKTGHYVDQRESRRRVGELAAGSLLLDLYAGTGGFGLAALRAGAARVVAVDSSAPAVTAARENAERNGVAERFEAVEADVLAHLDAEGRRGVGYDVVVADPPRFAATRQGVPKALAAYRRLNAKAAARVRPGGFLATFSCSGAVDPGTFAEVVRGGLRDAGRAASVLRVLGAGPDHPFSLAAPEGRYLTGLLLRCDA